MNRSIFFVYIIGIMGTFHAAQDNTVITRLTPRSPGRYRVIQIMNNQEFMYYECLNGTNVVIGVIPQYMSSTNAFDLAQSFFGNAILSDSGSKQAVFAVQGNNISPRNPRALFADYFYLPPDYDGIITVKPSIKNTLLNLDFYVGLDQYLSGFYIRLYGPITHTEWNLNIHETHNSFAAPDPAGYFTPGELSAQDLLGSFLSYARGQAPSAILGDLSVASPAIKTESQPIFFEPLQAARLVQGSNVQNGFADLRGELGWTFWKCDSSYCSINIQGAAPTGPSYNPCTLFSAQMGNNLWELGVGLIGCYRLYDAAGSDFSIDIAGDINVTHFFKRREWRTFDLIDKPLSRYMLAMQFNAPIIDNLKGGSITPTSQFNSRMAPVANLTTEKVIVSINLQADLVGYFHLQWYNFSAHLGYNFWGRSCEKITKDTDCNARFAAEKWALKGDARIFGFIQDTEGNSNNQAIALSATEHNATVHSGTNNSPNLSSPNLMIDGPLPATGGVSDLPLSINPAPGLQINTSIDSVLLTPASIHYDVGTSGLSHTFFSAIHYTLDCAEWSPFIGIGGFIEFGSTARIASDELPVLPPSHNASAKHRSSCIVASLSQWSIFFQCGISYRNQD